MFKFILTVLAVFGTVEVAQAESAFFCQTSQSTYLSLGFSTAAPRLVSLDDGTLQRRHVKGASSTTAFLENNAGEIRTYKFDFGSAGKSLVLNFKVPYDNPGEPSLRGTLDSAPFTCLSRTLEVEYTVLDRIVNER